MRKKEGCKVRLAAYTI